MEDSARPAEPSDRAWFILAPGSGTHNTLLFGRQARKRWSRSSQGMCRDGSGMGPVMKQYVYAEVWQDFLSGEGPAVMEYSGEPVSLVVPGCQGGCTDLTRALQHGTPGRLEPVMLIKKFVLRQYPVKKGRLPSRQPPWCARYCSLRRVVLTSRTR